MKEGIISVLYKKKARDDPRNYRPITLLNGDYKVFTRILTKRMNEAVLQSVSPSRTASYQEGSYQRTFAVLYLLLSLSALCTSGEDLERTGLRSHMTER